MPSDLIIGVKSNKVNDNTTTVTLSTTGQSVFSSKFLSSAFLQKNKWDNGKVRIWYNSQDASLFNEQYNQLSNDLQRVAFVAYESTVEASKLLEVVHLKEQFDLSGIEANEASIDTQNRVRDAATAALKALFDDDRELAKEVAVDDFDGHAQYAAEGAYLSNYQFYLDEAKQQKLKQTELSLLLSGNSDLASAWTKGKIISTSQNFAKWLEELPANYCTPTLFCELAQKRLGGSTKVQVEIHDEKWAKELNMNSYLSVSSGSDEPPRVLELKFLNNPNKTNGEIDLAFVGKGVTFDSGGISLKPGPDMKLMKADMGGAATVVASVLAIAELNLPLNVVAVNMMVENMINGRATRPGDVLTASNGKTIEIDNTDAEGRLALADGLVYVSKQYKPDYLIDMATLTGAIGVAIGATAAGCFTNSNSTWKLLEASGYETNEFLWRMPLFRTPYKKQLKALSADLNNIGGSAGGSCTAAVFLAEFVDHSLVKNWVHLDIAKVVIPKSDECGTGRPTRAVVRFAEKLANRN